MPGNGSEQNDNIGVWPGKDKCYVNRMNPKHAINYLPVDAILLLVFPFQHIRDQDFSRILSKFNSFWSIWSTVSESDDTLSPSIEKPHLEMLWVLSIFA